MIVLLQNNEEGYEKPIEIFSHALIDVELKYIILEKQAYPMAKYFK